MALPIRWRAVTFFLISLALVGCSGERLEPVEGKITVNSKTLVAGSLLLKPDAAKGNTATSEPAGTVESDGSFKLFTTQKPGAPAGWYKVIVVALEPLDPNNPYAERATLIDTKYNAEGTTDLTLEVRAGAPAGSYDKQLKK